MTRHRFDPLSFVVGATALAIAGVALARPEVLTLEDLRLAGPIVLLALGLAALITATTRGQGRDRDTLAASAPTTSTSDEPSAAVPDEPSGAGEPSGADEPSDLEVSQTDEAEAAADEHRG